VATPRAPAPIVDNPAAAGLTRRPCAGRAVTWWTAITGHGCHRCHPRGRASQRVPETEERSNRSPAVTMGRTATPTYWLTSDDSGSALPRTPRPVRISAFHLGHTSTPLLTSGRSRAGERAACLGLQGRSRDRRSLRFSDGFSYDLARLAGRRSPLAINPRGRSLVTAD
jgi:hypothetical protein